MHGAIHPQPQHYYPENDFDEGMQTFAEPFVIHEDFLDDRCGSTRAAIFFNLGISHARIGAESEALAYLEKSFQMQLTMTSISPVPGSIIPGPALYVILHNIGHSHFRQSRYAHAVAAYSQALDFLTRDRIEHHRFEISSTLNCIAVSKFYASQDDTDEILSIFEKALALRLDGPDAGQDKETATIINNTGRLRFLRGEFGTALIVYKKACKQRMAILGHDHVDVAASLVNIAQTLEYMGEKLEAVNFYKQFLNIALVKRGKGATDVFRAFLRAGQISYQLGNLEEAYNLLSWALNSAKAASKPNNGTVANVYNKIGNILFEQGKHDEALSAYKSGLALERTLYPHVHEQIAVTLLNIGRIYHRKEKLDDALELYYEALRIRRELRSEETVTTILFNIGLIHESKGMLDKAIDALGEAVALHRQTNEEKSLLASTLNALGLVQHKRGSLNLALTSFMEAIAIRKSGKSAATSYDIMNLYFNAAAVCKIMGEADKALEFYRELICLEQTNPRGDDKNHEQLAFTYFEIGLILKDRGDLNGALSQIRQSSQICLSHPHLIERSLAQKVFTALGDLYMQMGDTDNAMESYSVTMGIETATEAVLGNRPGNIGDFLYMLLIKTNPPAAPAA